jgi:MFS family permease
MSTSARVLLDHGKIAGWLLRSPGEAAEHCRDSDDLRALGITSIAAIALGGAAFGAVVGSFRGGWQIFFAAVKLPLAVLMALAVCVPAFHALAAVFGRPWRIRAVVALMLAASARASLWLLALSPPLWLAYDLGLGYHAAALAAAAVYGCAGLAALGVLLRGLGSGSGGLLTIACFAAVFFAAAGQTGWALRPYLVRPRDDKLTFARAPEGTFVESLWVGAHSAAGDYREEDFE